MNDVCERTTELLRRMKQQNDEDPDHGDQELLAPEPLTSIATLAPGITRPLSPMLRARFKFCSSWRNAYLDQDWLSLEEIGVALANPSIKYSIDLRVENWDSMPPESVKPEDCAIFGFNRYELEETYLVWEVGRDEPILWDYFGADYKMFNDLNRYLEYIVGERRVDDSGRVTAEP